MKRPYEFPIIAVEVPTYSPSAFKFIPSVSAHEMKVSAW
jgi:hypothetical protein